MLIRIEIPLTEMHVDLRKVRSPIPTVCYVSNSIVFKCQMFNNVMVSLGMKYKLS